MGTLLSHGDHLHKTIANDTGLEDIILQALDSIINLELTKEWPEVLRSAFWVDGIYSGPGDCWEFGTCFLVSVTKIFYIYLKPQNFQTTAQCTWKRKHIESWTVQKI